MINIEQVVTKIREVEEKNDQSILFTLNEDGSGSFEDFWNGDEVILFHSIEELGKILNERNSVAKK